MKRALVVLAVAALAVACSTAALSQTAAPIPSWTAAANSTRFPLLAPVPPAGPLLTGAMRPTRTWDRLDRPSTCPVRASREFGQRP